MEKLTQEKTVWEKANAFSVTCIIYLAIMLLLIILRAIFESGLLSVDDQLSELLFRFGSQIVIMLLVPVIAIKIFSKQSYKKTAVDFGFGRTSWRVIGFAVLLGVLLYIFNIFVASFFQAILSIVGYRFSSGGASVFTGVGGLLIVLMISCVFPGICEEATHRGMLMNSFSQKMGIGRAILFSSLIFGLMHMSIQQVFYTAIMGYFMAIAVLATRTIWTGVIIHFANNAIDTYLSFARDNNWMFGSILEPIFEILANPLGLVLLFMIIWGIYVLIMKVVHTFARENYKKNEKVLLAYFLNSNPQFLKQFVDTREPLSLDVMSRNIEHYVSTLSKREQVLYYVDTHKSKTPMTVLEKTLLFGVVFLGTVITSMTFVWGVFL